MTFSTSSPKFLTMYINRKISGSLARAATTFPAVVLTGARQTGKTTLLKTLFPDHRYVSLDLPSTAEQAERDPESFLAAYPPPVLIDEVQYAPGLFRHLKLRIDQERHQTGRFILTGSQKFPLMREVSDSLAGRCAIFELEPLSLSEILAAPGPDPGGPRLATTRLIEVMTRGGFPDLWRDRRINTKDFYTSYITSYLERDVRQLVNVASLRDFERFIRACAARNAQVLDKTALARDVGVSPKTINSWLSVLAASNQIVLLEPFFPNLGKRIVKSPKLYLTDTGLLASLLGVTADSILTSPFLGAVWETFVLAELRKSLGSGDARKMLWFYRDDHGLEVDFLLVGGGKADLIECKWSENPANADARAVRALASLAASRSTPELASTRGWLVCRTPQRHPLGGEVPQVEAVDLPTLIDAILSP